jgi:hypothetical protein
VSIKERLGLVETVHVGVGLNRRRVRPTPGTAVVELLNANGDTLIMDILKVADPAPRGPLRIANEDPATFVRVPLGPIFQSHQAFVINLDNTPYPIDLPQHLLDKIPLGATRARIWWSCETNG